MRDVLLEAFPKPSPSDEGKGYVDQGQRVGGEPFVAVSECSRDCWDEVSEVAAALPNLNAYAKDLCARSMSRA